MVSNFGVNQSAKCSQKRHFCEHPHPKNHPRRNACCAGTWSATPLISAISNRSIRRNACCAGTWSATNCRSQVGNLPSSSQCMLRWNMVSNAHSQLRFQIAVVVAMHVALEHGQQRLRWCNAPPRLFVAMHVALEHGQQPLKTERIPGCQNGRNACCAGTWSATAFLHFGFKPE